MIALTQGLLKYYGQTIITFDFVASVFGKKNQKTRDHHRNRYAEKTKRSITAFVYVSILWLFPEIALGDGPKNSRIKVKRDVRS